METLQANPTTSIQNRIKKIEELNLEPIIVKLINKKEGEGWTLEQALETEKWYKRFLVLNLKHQGKSIVPNKQIDTFWHYHILDTMKYEADCQSTLGFFLHHFPYFGMRSTQDAKNLDSAFDSTVELLKQEFGVQISDLAKIFTSENSSAVCDTTPSCYGPGCGGSKCGPEPADDRFERPTLSSVSRN